MTPAPDERAEALTILYTHQLHGDLARLPRLFTRLRERRAAANGRVLVFDLGESCAPDVWHCEITGGRSTLVALDGMGCDAARLDALVMPGAREKMGEFVQLALVDPLTPFLSGDICAFTAPYRGTPLDGLSLMVLLDVVEETVISEGLLCLAAVEGGSIGQVQLLREGNDWRIEAVDVYPSDDALPDPTIAGVVDFIVSEARYTQQRRGR